MSGATTVLLVIHVMVAAALVGLVLMQRSEGGVLGTGGGGFMSGRGQANFLTRTTAYLAAAFFATSIALTLLANHKPTSRSILETPAATQPAAPGSPAAPAIPGAPVGPNDGTPAVPVAPTTPTAPRGGILDKLQPPVPPKQN
jgi:preprotein translocase subunit SecG